MWRMKLKDDVLTVMSGMACDGRFARITDGQLDRKLYVAVNKALEALGGVWTRSAKAHVFPTDAATRIDGAIVAGEVTTDAEMGYFPTPPKLAAELVARAGVAPGMSVLEPSAGEGAIALAAARAGGKVTCIELDEGRVGTLLALGLTVLAYPGGIDSACRAGVDFLACDPARHAPRYDRVVLNPPFAKRQDIRHIGHALAFLRPGGVLVSVAAAGVAFRDDAIARDFRALVDARRGTIAPLPDDAFRASGTGVRTVVVTMHA